MKTFWKFSYLDGSFSILKGNLLDLLNSSEIEIIKNIERWES